ncbi:MAG: hypothetical protein NZ743_04150, partial [Pseudomonadales bacterium]|nr:hypothetical protein [Pseudomonadales bacterium]
QDQVSTFAWHEHCQLSQKISGLRFQPSIALRYSHDDYLTGRVQPSSGFDPFPPCEPPDPFGADSRLTLNELWKRVLPIRVTGSGLTGTPLPYQYPRYPFGPYQPYPLRNLLQAHVAVKMNLGCA